MEEDEKKQKKREWGENIGNIAQMLKYLKNPIIFYIAIGILILLLFLGIIGFFTSMPSGILGWITKNFLGPIKYRDNQFTVTQEELKALCEYIEEMGYDLEGYGFVEEIERSGAATYQDQEFANGQPSNGKIVSVKSKYLEAYLIAEKKSYVLANPKKQTDEQQFQNLFDYERICRDRAVEDAFNAAWPVGQASSSFFQPLIDLLYENNNNEYVKREGKQPSDDKSKEYDSYARISAGELREKIKKMVVTYYQYNNNLGSDWFGTERTTLLWGGYGNDIKMQYRFGESLMNQNEATKGAFQQSVTNIEKNYQSELSVYKNSGSGLIYLEDNLNENTNLNSDGSSKWKTNDGRAYEITIDENRRYFIVNTESIDSIWTKLLSAVGWSSRDRYAYNLNGWTCKYGKPTEFLIAMHLATQAPDFVYQVATSPAVDTKVHVALLPVNINLSFVISEDNPQNVKEMIEAANTDEENLKRYKDDIPEIISQLRENYSPNWWEALLELFQQNSDEANKKLEQTLADIERDLRGSESIKDFFQVVFNLIPEGHFKNLANITKPLTKKEYITLTTEGGAQDYSYEEVYGEEGIQKTLENYQEQTATATPYITKVVNHWYRNQYFTQKNEDLADKKLRLRTLILNVYSYINQRAEDGDGEFIAAEEGESESSFMQDSMANQAIKAIEAITSEEEVVAFVDNQKEAWTKRVETESPEMKEKVANEFIAVRNELESNVGGTAYEIIANPQPSYYKLADGNEVTVSPNDKINNFFKALTVEEQRNIDIAQKHNPLLEDNSQYIRNWLKEKYYIFDGTTQREPSEGETSQTETLSNSKVSQGKGYIQGKTALQMVTDMIETCTSDRENLIYMLRDLKELFEDFEFDLENVEIPAQKVLDNVMPDYIPYTPWPSIYEKAEDNCTKMIYKTTGAHTLVAPANGVITKSGNGAIEIEFTNDDEQTSATMEMTLHIKAAQGSVTGIAVGTKVKRGQSIGTASASDGMIILNLNLFSATKQLLKVENYMNVEKKSYDAEEEKYRLSDNEKILLYNLQEMELNIVKEGFLGLGGESQATISQRMSLMNVVFNKIASPYYSEYSDIEAMLNQSSVAKEAGFLKYSKQRTQNFKTHLASLERTENAKYAIINALNGIDYTKASTLLGATCYFGTDDEYYKGIGETEKERILQEIENLRIKIEISDRTFGITQEEYLSYLGEMIDKKINEVIYVLNQEKYVKGLEEYNELLEKFKPAKEKVKEYYEAGTFLDECSQTRQLEALKTVTTLVKSNIKQEYEELEDGRIKVTDKFTLTANSNYATKWTFTYTTGAEGKIDSEVKVEHEAIINF